MDTPGAAHPVVLGRIAGVYGVKGWVRVASYTRAREDILRYPCWLVGTEPRRVQAGRRQGAGVVAQLEGIDNRDQALALVGAEIAVRRSDLPALAPGEFYWADLIGLEVVTTQGVALGRVRRLFETGANDVLVVEGERERWLPYLKDVVKEVDLARGRMTVEWDADF